jgi:hypothetical protein
MAGRIIADSSGVADSNGKSEQNPELRAMHGAQNQAAQQPGSQKSEKHAADRTAAMLQF